MSDTCHPDLSRYCTVIEVPLYLYYRAPHRYPTPEGRWGELSDKMGSLEQVRRLANLRSSDPSRFPAAYLELKVRQCLVRWI